MESKFIKIIIKIIIFVAIILAVILSFSIYSNAKEDVTQEQKVEEEIKYLDTKLLSLINYLNNIDLQNYRVVVSKVEAESDSSGSSNKEGSGSSKQEDSSESGTDKEETKLSKLEEETIVIDNGEPDWQTIQGEIGVLYSTWPTIILDLYSLDINKEDILEFSTTLDETMTNIEKKEKTLSAMYLAKLYSYLPKFYNRAITDEIRKETMEAKSYIISAYAYAETSNWERIEEETEKAENIFENLVNDARFIEDKRKYNINKSYILISELKKSLSVKDKGIFYIKYKNTLQELNIIQ